MPKINSDIIDQIAQLEVDALLEGLNDPELRRNPTFLDKVRRFLKENQLQTTPETPGIAELLKKQHTTNIPIFKDSEEVGSFDVDRRAN